jgi:uncharacterized tellurite resistance protein B-like protein
MTNENYQLALLYLTHLLIDADGIMDEREVEALRIIKERENIQHAIFLEFEQSIKGKSTRETYCTAIDLVNQCTPHEKLNVYAILYKLSEVDGRVHTKEIRWLLSSLNDAGIALDEVVNQAKQVPAI